MFFMRTALVVGTVVVLLPSDPDKQQALLASTHDKVVWAMTYCDREPAQCDQAKTAWDGFVSKAQFSAKLVGEMADRYAQSADAGTAGVEEPPPQLAETVAPLTQQPKAKTRTATLQPKPVRIYRAPAAPTTGTWDQFQPD